MLLSKKTNTELPIGSIILGANNLDPYKWHKCDGSILLKSDYTEYVSSDVVTLHPDKWSNWDCINIYNPNLDTRLAADSIGDNIVIVGEGSLVNTSDDGGLTWTYNNSLNSDGWHYQIANNGSRFVTVKYNSNIAYYSNDFGITWTSTTLPVTSTWRYVCYNGSKFLISKYNTAMNSSTDRFLLSVDGINWTNTGALPAGAPIDYYYVGVANGKFIAVLRDSQRIYSSTDGSTWFGGDPHNFKFKEFDDATASYVCYFRNKYYLFFDEQRPYCLVSDDAISWDYYLIKNINRYNYEWVINHAEVNDDIILFCNYPFTIDTYDMVISYGDAPNVWQNVPGPFSLRFNAITYRNNNLNSWIVFCSNAYYCDDCIYRATYINRYDPDIYFQLPVYAHALDYPGMYYYIKVRN